MTRIAFLLCLLLGVGLIIWVAQNDPDFVAMLVGLTRDPLLLGLLVISAVIGAVAIYGRRMVITLLVAGGILFAAAVISGLVDLPVLFS